MSRSNSNKDEKVQTYGPGSQIEPTGEISKKLRALYDSVQEEAIPDHLLDLLDKLDHAEQANAQSKRK